MAPDVRYCWVELLPHVRTNTKTGETAEKKSFLTLKLRFQPMSPVPACAVMSISGSFHLTQLHSASSWTRKQFWMAGGKWETAFSLDLVPSSFTVTEEPRTSCQSPPLTIPTSQRLCQMEKQLQSTVTWWDTHLQSLCRPQGGGPHSTARWFITPNPWAHRNCHC